MKNDELDAATEMLTSNPFGLIYSLDQMRLKDYSRYWMAPQRARELDQKAHRLSKELDQEVGDKSLDSVTLQAIVDRLNNFYTELERSTHLGVRKRYLRQELERASSDLVMKPELKQHLEERIQLLEEARKRMENQFLERASKRLSN